MSYPGYDRRRDSIAALADDLLGCAAIVSMIVNHLSDREFADLPRVEQIAVYSDAMMMICDVLTEVGARHPAADIATAVRVLEDAVNTIGEGVFGEDGQCLACEGRGHVVRYKERRH
jgi:hypothetical protein